MSSASEGSINHGSKILRKIVRLFAALYCVVRPTTVVPVLNMCRHFSCVFPKQYSTPTIYIALTLY